MAVASSGAAVHCVVVVRVVGVLVGGEVKLNMFVRCNTKTYVCLYQLILMCNTFKFIGLCMQLFIVIVCQQACNANSMQSTTIDLRLKNAFFDIQCNS